MRRVDENELIVLRGEIDVHFQNFQFVARIFVQPDFADARDVRAFEKFRNDADDFLRASLTSSDSFGLMQSQQKCGMPNLAARFGSCSVSWQK